MPEWLIGLLSVAGTLSLGFLGYLATRRTGERARIGALEARVDQLDARSKRKDDYIGRLRKHIDDRNPPPPPPYPDDLFD